MPDVKVILRGDVAGLGKRGDIVEVSKGYSRNFLEPRGLAMTATAGAEAQAEGMRRSRILKDTKARESATEIATILVPKIIKVAARAGEGGRLFGSVTAADVAEAVEAQTGAQIDRRDIHIDEQIKTTGSHQVQVRLHPEVQFPVTLEVAGE
jgi:large subunit ribosomal protein L9